MRGLDTQKQLLDNAVTQYQQYYTLTETRFTGGVATEADVELAQTQLEQTRAQSIDVGAGAGAVRARHRRSHRAARFKLQPRP